MSLTDNVRQVRAQFISRFGCEPDVFITSNSLVRVIEEETGLQLASDTEVQLVIKDSFPDDHFIWKKRSHNWHLLHPSTSEFWGQSDLMIIDTPFDSFRIYGGARAGIGRSQNASVHRIDRIPLLLESCRPALQNDNLDFQVLGDGALYMAPIYESSGWLTSHVEISIRHTEMGLFLSPFRINSTWDNSRICRELVSCVNVIKSDFGSKISHWRDLNRLCSEAERERRLDRLPHLVALRQSAKDEIIRAVYERHSPRRSEIPTDHVGEPAWELPQPMLLEYAVEDIEQFAIGMTFEAFRKETKKEKKPKKEENLPKRRLRIK